jgi:BirA family transcriptional regulator, biotin operon repressor / biotin---[acetyl-CoA-carboxylase] ligase
MQTLFTGQNLIFLKSVDSTNSYAAELLRQNKQQEGTVVCSFNQTSGRGQRGNFWQVEPNKNATFSVIYYPVFLKPDEQFMLTKAISVGLAGLVTELLNCIEKKYKVNIKWPNDIYVDEKKIAGILIENTLADGFIKSSIIGIGLNVNQTVFSDISNATSLAQLSGENYHLENVVEKSCKYIEALYLQLKAGKIESINKEYLNYLYQLGEVKKYVLSDGTDIQGKITGVSKEGYLQISLSAGEQVQFDLKQIRFL